MKILHKWINHDIGMLIKYRLAIKNYFNNLDLLEKSWKIEANDGTIHTFTNYNIIDSFQNMTDDALQTILSTLEQFNGSRIKINSFLKKIALEYCNNRHGMIQALVEDYKKTNDKNQKKKFGKFIENFPKEDLETANVYDEWQKIKLDDDIKYFC